MVFVAFHTKSINSLTFQPISDLSKNRTAQVSTTPMDSKYKEAFQLLGLNGSNCSWNEVRTSYRRKVQRLHPDRAKDAEQAETNQEAFIRVTQAYKLLNEYHRKNNALPSDYQPQADPAMQMDLGDFSNISNEDIAKVLKSVKHDYRPQFNGLKIALVFCIVALLVGIGAMRYASWQQSQVPLVTPFSSSTPMPLTAESTDENN